MSTPLIDGHTHVFNVGFLPLDGLMRVRGVPSLIARGVTHVLERLLERELPAAGALADASARPALMAMLESELIADMPSRVAPAFDEPDLITRFVQLVPQRDLEALRPVLIESEGQISPATRAVTAMRTRSATGAAVVDPNADDRRRLAELLREAARYGGAIESDDYTAMGLESFSGRGLIEWLLLLVQHESRIVNAFGKAWAPPQTFALSAHHMMDMEPHYPGKPPVYPFATEQLRRMRAVAATAPIPLVAFVAYSPFRNEWESIIDGALGNGFIGVKFYPPNGYRPIGNTDSDVANGMKGATVNDRNLQLYRKCRPDVPIFTHCTSTGVEARPGITGKFSNPRHWRDVLSTAGLGDLRLCLGHAGGQEGWLAPPGPEGDNEWMHSYAHEVVELCVAYDNVYCDFGFFDSILAGDHATNFQLRLATAITRYGERFARKCCYGTDWHLVSREAHAAEYPERFARLLSGNDVIAPYADDILCGNALRFLNLPGFFTRSGAALGNAERSRLEALASSTASLTFDGGAANDGKGLDTTQDVTHALGQLADAGYRFVARYYSHNAWKTVKAPEAQAIANAGLDLVAVWQDANDSAGYFTFTRGETDGAAAFAYAKQIGQPPGSTIYFAVDYDASDADAKGRLVDYFKAVRAAFIAAGEGDATYDIGVYGSGAVCAALVAQQLVSRSWLALASGWRGYSTFKDWNLRQGDEKQIFGLTADPDRAQGDYGGFRVTSPALFA